MIEYPPEAIPDLRDMTMTNGWRNYYIPGLKAAKEKLRREFEYAPNNPDPERYRTLVQFYDFFIEFEDRLRSIGPPEDGPDTIDFVVK